jgi:phosphoribosylformimino-5-aminoimidazole carboxamide ribotide isomerase
MLKAACNEYPDRVAVGVDAKEGKTAIHGWVTETEEDALPFALRCQESGAAAIIYTDISRDGMLTGPNLDAVKEMAEALRIPLVASGGVSSLGDIRAVLGLEKYGVEGIIVGKALYTGAVSLVQAIDMTRGSRREC